MTPFSLGYLFFCLVVFILFCLAGGRLRIILLAVASLAFYAASSPLLLWYVVCVLGIVSRITHQHFEKGSTPSITPVIGVSCLFLLLFVFKYSLPFLSILGVERENFSSFLKIIYPLGVSYVTFQAVGLIVDLRNQRIEVRPDLAELVIYLFFFPKVLSGPVEKAYQFLPRLKSVSVKAENIRIGLMLVQWGCFKKLVIADKLGLAVDKLYGAPNVFSNFDTTIVTIFYAIQVYADFSGYSDIALGTCLLFGIVITQNFRSPFLSRSITEFWRRWHISLGQWFNEYYYTNVALVLRSFRKMGVYISLLTTFFLIGLWHGPTSGFILFGLIHGVIIVYELMTKNWRSSFYGRLPEWVNRPRLVIVTFSIYSLSCVFFRSESFAQSLLICKKSIMGVGQLAELVVNPGVLLQTVTMFATKFGYYKLDILVLLSTITLLVLIDIGKGKEDLNDFLDSKPRVVRWTFYYLVTTSILFFGSFNSVQSFIYRQF